MDQKLVPEMQCCHDLELTASAGVLECHPYALGRYRKIGACAGRSFYQVCLGNQVACVVSVKKKNECSIQKTPFTARQQYRHIPLLRLRRLVRWVGGETFEFSDPYLEFPDGTFWGHFL